MPRYVAGDVGVCGAFPRAVGARERRTAPAAATPCTPLARRWQRKQTHRAKYETETREVTGRVARTTRVLVHLGARTVVDLIVGPVTSDLANEQPQGPSP